MGRLTDDMTRLREEIDSSHKTCKELVSDLKENVGEMLAGFREDNFKVAEETKAKLWAFASNLRDKARAMRAGFQEDNLRRAEKVKSQLSEFRAEMTGALRAWAGSSPAELKVKEETKNPGRRKRERGSTQTTEETS